MFSCVEYEISCITSCISFARFTFTYLKDKMLRVLGEKRRKDKSTVKIGCKNGPLYVHYCKQTVWILIRQRFLWRSICFCTVCLCLIKWTIYLYRIFCLFGLALK